MSAVSSNFIAKTQDGSGGPMLLYEVVSCTLNNGERNGADYVDVVAYK